MDHLPAAARPERSTRIDIFSDEDAEYWAQALGVSRVLLETVVRKLGTSVKAVRRELER